MRSHCELTAKISYCIPKTLICMGTGIIPLEITKKLALQDNKITVIPLRTFLSIPYLTHLNLQRCKIKSIEEGAFRGLGQLVYLNLASNNIAFIYQESKWASANFLLITAMITEILIAEHCPQICTCDSIKHQVICSNRNLTKVPVNIPQITKKLALLDHNNFTQMPKDAFRYLPNLFAFHLQHNSISQLSDNALAGMKQLRCLYLTGNHITYLSPKALKQAKMLEKLHLDENSLQEIPTKALRGLPILNELKLSKNPIKYIGNGAFLPIARSLQHLYLDNMALQEVSFGAFTGLGPNIKSLYLEKNGMYNLPNLHGFTALEVINLNDIPFSCDCRLLPLRNSAVLELIITNLCWQVSFGAFTGLGPNIKSLYLEKNGMYNLPNLHGFTALEVINLNDIPFSCDCRLLPLRKWLDNLNLRAGATCGSPPNLYRQKVKLVTIFQNCPGWNIHKAKQIS
ncbi:chondroadherin-like protein [Ahaetulla prasina]|uniref:chondroadherin-like protein n=1 Tax=Ahaetulla prasina TaxID=499056 RepID=UPI0026488882|nr:chondroadherin-like protein [Ahaetulla prasina]